jgi:hypothetical protein
MRLRTVVSFYIFLASALSATGAMAAWQSEQDPDIGFTFSYPDELFERTEGDGKPFSIILPLRIQTPNSSRAAGTILPVSRPRA